MERKNKEGKGKNMNRGLWEGKERKQRKRAKKENVKNLAEIKNC